MKGKQGVSWLGLLGASALLWNFPLAAIAQDKGFHAAVDDLQQNLQHHHDQQTQHQNTLNSRTEQRARLITQLQNLQPELKNWNRFTTLRHELHNTLLALHQNPDLPLLKQHKLHHALDKLAQTAPWRTQRLRGATEPNSAQILAPSAALNLALGHLAEQEQAQQTQHTTTPTLSNPTQTAVKNLAQLHKNELKQTQQHASRHHTPFLWGAGGLFLLLAVALGFQQRKVRQLSRKNDRQSQKLEATLQEQQIQDETRDNFRQQLQGGFCEFRVDGLMVGVRSAQTEQWWGKPETSCDLVSWIHPIDPDFSQALDKALDAWDGSEEALSTLPTVMRHDQQQWKWHYLRAVSPPDEPDRILATILDESPSFLRDEAQGQVERLELILSSLRRDHGGFLLWWDRAAHLIETLAAPGLPDAQTQRQQLYTLEGELRWGGLDKLAEQCRSLASTLQDEDRHLLRHEGQALQESWRHWARWLEDSQERRQGVLPIDRDDALSLIAELREGAGSGRALRVLQEWTRQPVQQALERLADRARSMATHRDCFFEVHVKADTSRVDPQRWAPIWSALIHILRNAMDHGLESPEERKAEGKSPSGRIELHCERIQGRFLLRVRDDGRGINWHGVAEKARQLTLPHETQEDLGRALFHRGLSTSDTKTDLSGLGMGLYSARQACLALGGEI